uniref:G-protein coupled receptors family 1 profile domain-containing protein n=1 Tax=Erpetoichthys calabaricus TaxID=27687 RepID=A0A8C4X380_ERPCA
QHSNLVNGMNKTLITKNITCSKIYSSLSVNVTVHVIFITGIILTVCGNLALIISISHFKQLYTPSNVLILSMAFADLIIGIFNMPVQFFKTTEVCWYKSTLLCFSSYFTTFSITNISVYHLLLLAGDRYYAVCYPLFYSMKVTMKVIWTLLAIVWSLSIFYSYCLLLIYFALVFSCTGYCSKLRNFFVIFIDYVLTFIIPFSVMIGLYTKILFVAKIHRNKINFGEQNGLSSKQKADKLSFKRQYKAMKTVGTLILVFLACWTPYYLFHFAASFVALSRGLLYALEWTALFNSSFNPLIYGFFYPWFRKAFKIFLTSAMAKVALVYVCVRSACHPFQRLSLPRTLC